MDKEETETDDQVMQITREKIIQVVRQWIEI